MSSDLSESVKSSGARSSSSSGSGCRRARTGQPHRLSRNRCRGRLRDRRRVGRAAELGDRRERLEEPGFEAARRERTPRVRGGAIEQHLNGSPFTGAQVVLDEGASTALSCGHSLRGLLEVSGGALAISDDLLEDEREPERAVALLVARRRALEQPGWRARPRVRAERACRRRRSGARQCRRRPDRASAPPDRRARRVEGSGSRVVELAELLVDLRLALRIGHVPREADERLLGARPVTLGRAQIGEGLERLDVLWILRECGRKRRLGCVAFTDVSERATA